MAGRPVFGGAVQLTFRLVVDPGVADTEGAAGGVFGGSLTFVTLIVTAMVSVAPLPSSAFTVTA